MGDKFKEFGSVINFGGVDFRPRVSAVANLTGRRQHLQRPVGAVVDIQHRQRPDRVKLAFGLPEAFKQQPLGLQVGIPRAVVVEMLMGDVGDHADIEIAARNAPGGQSVGGGLQNCVGDPSIDELAQVSLDFESFGGGDMQTGIQRLIADDRIDGRDHPDFQAGSFHDLVEEIDGGGLAVRAGHADHRQVIGRAAVKHGGDVGQRAAGIPHLDVGHVQRQRLGADHRGGAIFDRIRNILVPIDPVAGRYKDISGLDLARVYGNPADFSSMHR